MLNGKHTVTIGGKQYTLVLDINAMADLEQVTGKRAFDILEAIERGDISIIDMRAVMWAILQAHHSDIDLRGAGALLSQAPEVVNKTISAAMPPPVESPAPDAAGNAPAAMTS